MFEREEDRDARRPAIVITGASGLIGSRLTEHFAKDCSVAALDIERPERLPADASWVRCDLTDDGSTEAALAAVAERCGRRLASVIHLAAYYDFSGEPSPLYQDLTVEGTRRLLRGLGRFEVEQFVFSSTMLVMRPAARGEAITEDSPEEGSWPYPASKIEAEEAIRAERGGIPAVILRIAGVYDEDCHSIPIAQQVRRIFEKKLVSYFFPGDPTHRQPFVHLDDLVSCVDLVVRDRHRLGPFEVFLVAEPSAMSYEDLQERIGRSLHGRAWPTIRVPVPVAKAGAWVREKLSKEDPFIKPWMVEHADDDYPVSVERIRRKLGWEPVHRLERDLDVMLERLKDDPERWYRENHLPVEKAAEATGAA